MVINNKIFLTNSVIKTEHIAIKFWDSTFYFILAQMIDSIEPLYLKDIEEEKMLMHKYDDIIMTIRTNNKKIDDVVKEINNKGVKLHEEIQEDK